FLLFSYFLHLKIKLFSLSCQDACLDKAKLESNIFKNKKLRQTHLVTSRLVLLEGKPLRKERK
ncbi:MAG TPA: hypothetical protein H9863_04850, partial [Candidatus Odoribacter faecigallinarum]|nr:hypothetical protein [Candidatus Odoribacter faecigallinarum]